MRALKRDGSWAEVVLLRPVSWLEDRGARVGRMLEIAVPECGIDGDAEVLAIEPCPSIKPGKGRVVIGTFKHQSAKVIDLHIEGVDKSIGTTTNHPFWSEDQQQLVAAGELRIGERLRTLGGTPRLLRVVQRPKPEAVYNIEVQGVHVYYVASAGVLVHNGGGMPTTLGPKTGGVYIFYTANESNKTVSGYIGSAKDFWQRLSGQREKAMPGPGIEPTKRDYHLSAIEQLSREGVQMKSTK